MSFKKLILVGAVVGVGVFALKGTKMFGHAKQEVTSLVEWAESSLVTPEKEISRLRKEVSALDKDIRNVGAALAKETVEVKYLREDSGKMKGLVTTEHEKIVARSEVISAATEKVAFGSRMISPTEAKEKLNADVQRQLSRKKTLDGPTGRLAEDRAGLDYKDGAVTNRTENWRVRKRQDRRGIDKDQIVLFPGFLN